MFIKYSKKRNKNHSDNGKLFQHFGLKNIFLFTKFKNIKTVIFSNIINQRLFIYLITEIIKSMNITSIY